MSRYFDECCRAMSWLAEQPNAIFIGQAVRYPGTAMHNTLKDVPMEKRIEFPVAENMQLGACIGLSLSGFSPVCIFPRINFLLEAMSQLVQHLDKLSLYSDGGYCPHVIVRTAIATDKPLNPGEQHIGDYAPGLIWMLDTVHVQVVDHADDIMSAYRYAVEREGSSLIVEKLEHYG